MKAQLGQIWIDLTDGELAEIIELPRGDLGYRFINDNHGRLGEMVTRRIDDGQNIYTFHKWKEDYVVKQILKRYGIES